MTEMIRYGDVCGYDDAEIIDIDDGAVLVIDTDERSADYETQDGQHDV